MKGLKISLIYLCVCAILTLPGLILSKIDFWEIISSYLIIGTLFNLLLLFLAALLTFFLFSLIKKRFSIIKATILRVIIFSLTLALLNELLILVVKISFPTVLSMNDSGDSNTYFSLSNIFANLPWTIKAGALFVLIWTILTYNDDHIQEEQDITKLD